MSKETEALTQIGTYAFRGLNLLESQQVDLYRSLYSSVYGFCCDADNNILVVQHNIGFDIPGGHIEKRDVSLFDTVVREIQEETRHIIPKENLLPFAESWVFGGDPVYGNKKMLYMGAKIKNFDSLAIAAKTAQHTTQIMPFSQYLEQIGTNERRRQMDYLQLLWQYQFYPRI